VVLVGVLALLVGALPAGGAIFTFFGCSFTLSPSDLRFFDVPVAFSSRAALALLIIFVIRFAVVE
jgi:hypothetical protein